MIRRATIDDLSRAVAFAVEFHAESVHADIPVNIEALSAFMAGLIEQGAVFLSNRGLIGGVIAPAYFNPEHRMAVELFWWAPTDGQPLRRAWEDWAVQQGAATSNLTSQVNARSQAIEKMYRRAGYVPTEVTFVKRL